jgi:rhomboid protease GluP
LDEQNRPGLLDEIVELVAKAMDAVGLNGRRLRWRWTQRQRDLAERKASASVMLRSARGRHKMCTSCGALVPRSARQCPECGEDLSTVRAPGVNRLLANLFPGALSATTLILLANGFWFLLVLLAQINIADGGGSFWRFDGELLIRFGAGLSRPVRLSDGTILLANWWRLVTAIFLHGGLIHFGFNSWVLMQLGRLAESEYGTKRFWGIYLVSGIAGNIAAVATYRAMYSAPVPIVGASGAIFGLVGLLIVYGWRRGGVAGQQLRSFLLRYAIFMFIISLAPGISLAAHAGGFAAGALLGLVIPAEPIRGRSENLAWDVIAAVGVLLVLYSFYQVAVLARASAIGP